jgi:hypothetical protein
VRYQYFSRRASIWHSHTHASLIICSIFVGCRRPCLSSFFHEAVAAEEELEEEINCSSTCLLRIDMSPQLSLSKLLKSQNHVTLSPQTFAQDSTMNARRRMASIKMNTLKQCSAHVGSTITTVRNQTGNYGAWGYLRVLGLELEQSCMYNLLMKFLQRASHSF